MANEAFEVGFHLDSECIIPLTVSDVSEDRVAWTARYTLTGDGDNVEDDVGPININPADGTPWLGCSVYHCGTGLELLEFVFEDFSPDTPSSGTITATDEGVAAGKMSIRYEDWKVRDVEIEMTCSLEDLGHPARLPPPHTTN